MLSDALATAFIPTTDADRARAFYEGVLGLKLIDDDGHALVFDLENARMRVVRLKEFTPFPFTHFGWHVDDAIAVVNKLTGGGVTFEHYDFVPQDASGIWTTPAGNHVAWFKDPDGNLLSISD